MRTTNVNALPGVGEPLATTGSSRRQADFARRSTLKHSRGCNRSRSGTEGLTAPIASIAMPVNGNLLYFASLRVVSFESTDCSGGLAVSRKVVMVHGLWYRQLGLALLRRRLAQDGLDCHGFSYPALRRPLAANARALFDFALALDADRLDFVGHSLGGLVILHMLDGFGGLPPGRVVLLGSPVRGSAVASEAADLPLIRRFFGRARTALEYTCQAAPADRETGIVAGTGHVGVGRLFRSLKSPSDGVVAVEECRLQGTTDELVLPVTHTGLVLAPAVAGAVARFLRSGSFENGLYSHVSRS